MHKTHFCAPYFAPPRLLRPGQLPPLPPVVTLLTRGEGQRAEGREGNKRAKGEKIEGAENGDGEGWLGGAVVRASDLCSRGSEFGSRSLHYRVA